MKIDLAVLGRQYELHAAAYEAAALRALRSGWYIMGPELEAFEEEFAAYMGAKYAIGLNSGLDALMLSVAALGIGAGDEVIVPANTYIATVLAVTANGATPIFVEPDEYYNLDTSKLEAAITERTRAVMPVHLYGQAANMGRMMEIAARHQLAVVEDCAQSHGAHFGETMTGRFGAVGCFSFYPTKNLGAFGDAGAIVTDDVALAERIRMLRNYGSKEKYHNELCGINSRLDEIQAALLRVKLGHLSELSAERLRRNTLPGFITSISACRSCAMGQNMSIISSLCGRQRAIILRHISRSTVSRRLFTIRFRRIWRSVMQTSAMDAAVSPSPSSMRTRC